MKRSAFSEFAKYYDIIYQEKNYEREVDFLEEIFGMTPNKKKILEVGCGTGNYTKILIERGYDVSALDISDDMLKIARKKCKAKFLEGDIRNITLNEQFDVCIAMFAVMGYMIKNSHVLEALTNVNRHLKSNGLFIFDVWNGLAVMRTLPEKRIKEVENDKVKITRFAIPKLRAFQHLCEVNYKFFILDKSDGTLNEFKEKHAVRFYFPQEIKHYLEYAGFDVLRICPFLNLNGKVDENVWNITIIARKK